MSSLFRYEPKETAAFRQTPNNSTQSKDLSSKKGKKKYTNWLNFEKNLKNLGRELMYKQKKSAVGKGKFGSFVDCLEDKSLIWFNKEREENCRGEIFKANNYTSQHNLNNIPSITIIK